MRIASIPLVLSFAALAAGCSSGSSSSPAMLPETNASSQSQPASSSVNSLSAGTSTSQSSRSVLTTTKTTALDATNPVFPSDFPVSAEAGVKARLAPLASDHPVGSALAVAVMSGSAKTATFMRADGSALGTLYYPVGTTVPTGSIYLHLGENVAVPRTSAFADDGTWADTSAGQRATVMVSTYYANPARVAVLDLNGDVNATPLPSAAPSATASVKPSASPTAIAVVAPSTNGCVHFRSNPMCTPLPSTKAVASNSGSWSSLLFQSGRAYFQHIESTSDPTDINDSSEPIFPLDSTVASVTNVIACDKTSWSQYVCGGKSSNGTMQLPANLVPGPNSDHHASIADSFRQGEQDFWLASAPAPNGGTMHVGGAGFCSWSGNGTNCSGSTATNIATSLGGVDPVDVQKAESSPNGVLPYSISVAALCADPSYVFPATASDGSNTNSSSACYGHTGAGQRPPEGTRGFIDKSDADINASSNAPYVKAILRTMDREHYGLTITDTNWSGAPGLATQYSTAASAAWAFALREAGISSTGTQWLPITNNGINMQADIKFCSNGTC